MTPRDVTTGRLPATPADLQQPLPAVETGRPVVDRETPRETSRLHEWAVDLFGEVDIFAYNPVDPHNGPRCVRCHVGFCHHCEPGKYQEECYG